ncbi:pyridoxal 5'-phosphate synthase glutaminase subunit PdxT [Candidatus Gracilibacteria bacterium]|nr:pyridoxal 5'-phosphate synthase glutaminase subunit PdxT [Candidatus Gracilibacteria bacterium]
MKIGILDIQGSVEEHISALQRLGAEIVRVKNAEDLEGLDGLVMPGGESTTMEKLMKRFGLWEAIIGSGLPIYGTCAGAILLAKMGLIDMEVERNAYGGQLESFETELDFEGGRVPAVFIRAPRFVNVEKVEVLSRNGEEAVCVRQGKIMASSFHPEMAEDTNIHRYFLDMC